MLMVVCLVFGTQKGFWQLLATSATYKKKKKTALKDIKFLKALWK